VGGDKGQESVPDSFWVLADDDPTLVRLQPETHAAFYVSLLFLALGDPPAGTPHELVDLVGFTGEGWLDLLLWIVV
jgi:hypothetical protein